MRAEENALHSCGKELPGPIWCGHDLVGGVVDLPLESVEGVVIPSCARVVILLGIWTWPEVEALTVKGNRVEHGVVEEARLAAG